MNAGPTWMVARRPSRLKWVVPGVFALVALILIGAGLLANLGPRNASSGTQRRVHPSAAQQQAALAPLNLVKPLTPEQAIKANEDRPFDATPDSPARQFKLSTDETSRDRAVECLAQAVYYEAATESPDGQRAVAQVVLNRMRHPGFPPTVCGVVYQGSELPTGCQFTFTCDGSLARTPVPAVWARARKIAEEALAGHVFAAVGHATYYHADYVLPYWADSMAKQVQIGHHIFYRLRGTLGTSAAFSQHYGGKEPDLTPPPSTVAVASQAADQAQAILSAGPQTGPPPVAADAAGLAGSNLPKQVLLADSNKATLLIDHDAQPAQAKKSRSPDDCPAVSSKRILPSAPNDLKAGGKPSDC